MSNSDSFFDDDSTEMDSFAGEPSEELLRESKESFENLSDMDALDDLGDTPDAVLDKSDIVTDVADEITGDEAVPAEAAAVAAAGVMSEAEAEPKKRRFNIDWAEVTIFDAILVVSLVFISLATLLLFFELRQFGNFPFGGFPWRTDGF